MGIMRSTLGFFGLGGDDDAGDQPIGSFTGTASATRTGPGRGGHNVGGVGPGLTMRGEVHGEGDFDIFGRFEGEITVVGRVYVAEGAQVDANITAAAITIGGTVRGNLSATTRVEIMESGVLTGTLKTGSFSAADGASVKGEMWIERGGSSGRGPAPADS
jgi:cytoskeletal protein CcmA (bactofilin family)